MSINNWGFSLFIMNSIACVEKKLNLDQEIFLFLYTNPKGNILFVSTIEIVMSKKAQAM